MDTNSMMSLAALVRARNAGKANPELMVALCRDAIARKDRRIRAFAHVSEAAPAQAAGPLAGIAIGVKDILDTFDQPTAYGSPVYEGHQPRVDAAIVDLARRKGAPSSARPPPPNSPSSAPPLPSTRTIRLTPPAAHPPAPQQRSPQA
jgi:Asp-tRNA(Asn)/Glu-tRNA(Gln) amidotransferase A subunit family amidase